MSGYKVDEKDFEILSIIRDAARMSYMDIGKLVGLSRVSVKRRIEQMERRKIITGYRTLINEEVSSKEIRFYLDLEIVPDFYDQAIRALAPNYLLKGIYRTTGSSRIHVDGIAPNAKILDSMLHKINQTVEGIQKMECHTILATIKRDGILREGFEE